MSEQFCAYVSKCIKLNLNFRMRMFSKFYIHLVWIILAALLKVLFKLLLVGIFFFSWDNAIQTWFTNPYCRFCGIFGVWEQKSPTNALVKIVHFRGSDKILQRSQQFLRIPLFSRAITESLDICLLWSTMDQKLLIYRWIWCQNIIRRNEIWLEARML